MPSGTIYISRCRPKQPRWLISDDFSPSEEEINRNNASVIWLMGYGREVSGLAAARQFVDYFHDQAFKADIQILSLVCGAGRQVTVPYTVGYDIAGGKMTALRIYMPMDVLMRQLNDNPNEELL